MKNRILIIGGYGFGNLGDEAVLNVIIGRFRKETKSNTKITVLSYDPQETKKLHGVNACGPLGTLIEIMRSHEVIIGGGEVIIDYNKPWFLYLIVCISLVILAKLFKREKKMRFYAIGVHITNPVRRAIISKLMNFSDEISVRNISEKDFRDLGVRKKFSVVPDPALDLEPVDSEKARMMLCREGVNLTKFLVGLSVASVKNKELCHTLVRVVSQVVDWLLSQFNTEVVFISSSNHKFRDLQKDLLIAERLYRAINLKRKFRILRRNYTPQELKAIIGQMNLFIGMRLHPLIFAYEMGVPLISIAYYKRVESFCELYSQNRINLDRIDFKELKKEIIHKISSNRGEVFPESEKSLGD